MKLRVRSKAGVTNLDIDPTTTFAHFKATVGATELRSGFPPKPLTADDAAPISTLLSNGDTVIVQSTSSAPRTPAQPQPQTRSQSNPTPKAPAPPPPSSILSQGTLTMRVVPDDNSCLFRSVNGILGQPRASVAQLRRVVCSAVAENPALYSDAFLGKSNAAYQKWIMSENAWGGAIELSILCQHFKLELAAFDIKTMRLDRYGEGNSYKTAGFLLYDGIHYNYVALSLGAALGSDADVTQFDVNDALVVDHVRALARKEHDAKKFTDTATFLLKCGQCGTRLKGEAQAVEHAEKTGHTQFTEN